MPRRPDGVSTLLGEITISCATPGKIQPDDRAQGIIGTKFDNKSLNTGIFAIIVIIAERDSGIKKGHRPRSFRPAGIDAKSRALGAVFDHLVKKVVARLINQRATARRGFR